MEMELAASEDKIPSLDTKDTKSVATTTTTPISSLDNTKSKQTAVNNKISVKPTSKNQPIVVLPILGKNKIMNATKSKQIAEDSSS